MAAPKKNKFAEGGEGPSKYKEEYDEQVYKLCLLGAKDKEIASFFEVEEQTINNWKKAHPSFFESLKKGKLIADAEIANSFHKRAKGYEYKEVYFEKVDSKVNLELTPDELITTDAYKKKIVIKELPPEPGAALSWLKNRRPDDWRDKIDLDHSNKGKEFLPPTNIDLSKLSDAALREIINAARPEESKD